MKLITAIVRTVGVDNAVKRLEEAGFRGITISEIKGIGDAAQINKPYATHVKIEIVVTDEGAEKVTTILLETTRSGLAGDGILTVATLDSALKIRTKEPLG